MPSRRALAAASTFAALSVADTVLAGQTSRAARRSRMVVKPLLMPALRIAFSEATPGRYDRLARSTKTAQGLSWAGDVALLGSGERAFLTGVGSFFGAHLAYIAGFASVRDQRAKPGPSHRPGVLAALTLWTVSAPVLGLAARRSDPKLTLPVVAYAGVLSTMFASSTLVGPEVPPHARTTIRAGTGLFLLSDSILGVKKFLLPGERPVLESAVMATYTAGQALIAAGVANARR
jgi:uncharacterized membrane protein YhhN